MQMSSESASSLSIVRYLGGAGCGLWLLVMALEPDPGFSAPWPWMALFWFLQISAGLTVLQATLLIMSRIDQRGRWPLWLLVVMSGFCGAVLLTPIYWLIGEGLMQQVLGFAETPDADGPLGVQQTTVWTVLLDEWLEISGPVIASWALISWPRLQGLWPPLVQGGSVQVGGQLEPKSEASIAVEQGRPRRWRASLPAELGDDVIAVKSELQYLRVWTSRGCALVLGSLQEVEDAEGNAGMRMHRSWWVHARHVRTVRRSGETAVCELSDGREVPVSRRRKADAVARFGDQVRYEARSTASKKARGPADQNARRNPT